MHLYARASEQVQQVRQVLKAKNCLSNNNKKLHSGGQLTDQYTLIEQSGKNYDRI